LKLGSCVSVVEDADAVARKVLEYVGVLNFGLIDEEIGSICTGAGISMEDDITEEERVVCDVVATEIEHPSDVVQSSHEHHVAACTHLCCYIREFALYALASVLFL